MPFKKGQSGNPSGKPKTLLPDGRSLSDLCKVHTAKAVDALIEVIDSEDTPPAARVAAINAILDRGWGKAVQAVEMTGKDGGPIQTEQRVIDDGNAVASAIAGLVERAKTDSVAGGTKH